MMEYLDILLKTGTETITFIIPLLILIFTGLFIIEVLFQWGMLKRFEVISKPLTKLANLPPACAIPLISAIGSHLAANTMLQQLRNDKVIKDREVLLASILSTIFVPIKEIKFHLGIIIPTLGLYVGGFYVAVMWLGTIVLIGAVILAGRLFLPKRKWDSDGYNISKSVDFENDTKKDKFKFLRYSLNETLKTFKKISILFLITTFIIFLLINMGIFDIIITFIEPSANVIGIPANAIPALTAYIASPLVGYPMIGALIENNEISNDEAIIVLLFGSMFMLPVIYLKFYFPQWVSVFGLKLGLIRGLISMSLIMLTRGIILIVFLIFFKT
ncbi:MAG: hypothetical protein GW779_03230 [Candidatus Altiarchaeum hamiconexum]|uniref:Nucleoside recognition protein n=1 Tax=Candidatus Altarchaeum hamiconexum TaxID=1803513 RepID=A0A8J8CJW2_9ARCH|nr:hypothetical protein [Candidatus Altarchaeum hamiconexum]PIV27100.1 MAG: hypothetical protein COS36_06955 [Candidatus Altarchaeum sp. CG03_land_8_20_14_0_80_32_618]PJC13369.1 MAG: hypothetical protein CO063_04445 [Candidatus Altarchaeum sp. CG_4_9_14_0_8_um_filter_32_206]NCN68527.1 hypothetical protein [Candidatus Altarchaeum hamiconexum]NCS91412.1 hypothetical protein [Candidatus Altarchaeum hamiconexum]